METAREFTLRKYPELWGKNHNAGDIIRAMEEYAALRQPPVSGECEHPYHSVLGDGEMQPAKCLKCGKVL